MKFIIDSANIEKLERLLPLGVTNGITTNPSILHKEGLSRKEQLIKLSALTKQTIFVQLVGNTTEEIVQDYNNLVPLLKDLGLDYVIKVAIDRDGLLAIKQIKDINADEKFLGTTIYSTTQAILAVMAGCQYLAPYYNRMIVDQEDANLIISDIRNYIEDHDCDCIIVAASLKSAQQVRDALMSGAHTCTLDADLLESLMLDDRVTRDLQVFEKHHQEFES